MFRSPFWEKVSAAAQRTDSTLYQVFKDLCKLHTPIDEVIFTVHESGDGKNGYHHAMSYGLGIEVAHASHWEAWEHVLKIFDPFNKIKKRDENER